MEYFNHLKYLKTYIKTDMSNINWGGGNIASFPDIHSVSDGKLIRYNIHTKYSIGDKQRIIASLIELVNRRADPSVRNFGVKGLEIIARDAGSSANWQPVDGLFADDTLVDICIMLSQITDGDVVDTALNHISEQMSDMFNSNGLCSAGRNNRLFQVYMVLRDYLG